MDTIKSILKQQLFHVVQFLTGLSPTVQKLFLKGLKQPTTADAQIYFENAFSLHHVDPIEDYEKWSRLKDQALVNLSYFAQEGLIEQVKRQELDLPSENFPQGLVLLSPSYLDAQQLSNIPKQANND